MTNRFRSFLKKYRLVIDILLPILAVSVWLFFLVLNYYFKNKYIGTTDEYLRLYYRAQLNGNDINLFYSLSIALLFIVRSLYRYWFDLKDKRKARIRVPFNALTDKEKKKLTNPIKCKFCKKSEVLLFTNEFYGIGEYYLRFKCKACEKQQKIKRNDIEDPTPSMH